MKIADMLEDRSTLEETQRAAKEIMARDPELSSPESAALKTRSSGFSTLSEAPE